MINRRAVMLAAFAGVVPGISFSEDCIRVPVLVTFAGTPLVSVTIEGKGPYRFVVDTGAYASGIRDSLAKELQLSAVRNLTINGLGGTEQSTLYRAHEIVFGNVLRQADVGLIGFRSYRANDGVLAAGFLTSYPSILDYESGEIRIYPNAPPDISAFTPLDGQLRNDTSGGSKKIIVRMSIDGIPLRVLFDTGAVPELLLSPNAVRKHHLWDKFAAFKEGMESGVTGDVSQTRIVAMPKLDMGNGLALDSTNVTLMEPGWSSIDGVDGVVGSRLLRQFSLAVTPNSGIALLPNGLFRANSGAH